jgi:hypothetical protein
MEGLPFPKGFTYLWDWYGELGSSRQNGMAPNPLTFTEIKAWADLTQRDVAPWEIEIIKTIDNSYLRTGAEHRREQKEKAKANAAAKNNMR